MIQSLVPAFSQLLAPEKKEEFDRLFSRVTRLNLMWLLPATMLMVVIAKPFFTIWAGAEFGAESTNPFYILVFGLCFNIFAYIPHSVILASGRTDIFAKLYWIELVIYILLVIWLVNLFQIKGAAMAWSLRVIFDALIIIRLSKKIAGVSFKFSDFFYILTLGGILLLPPVLFAVFYDNFSLLLFALAPLSLFLYAVLVWKKFIDTDERKWIINLIKQRF